MPQSVIASTLAPLAVYFFSQGIANVMLGPLLPGLIVRWHIQDAQAGTLFVALFTGQLIGAFVATWNLRASLLLGSLTAALGSLAIAWTGYNVTHLALLLMGGGIGAGLTAGNVIAGTAISSGRSRWLALLNVGWSIGAITCPALVRFCRIPLFFFVLAAILGLAGAITFKVKIAKPVATTAQPRLPLPVAPLAVFAVALLLYIGIENALGGWLPSYATRISPLLLASSVSLWYWLAELAGRSLMAAVKHSFSELLLLRASLLLLIASILYLVFKGNPHPAHIAVLTVLCGLAIAPIYPLLVSFLLARTGSHPRLGPLFASASLGGAVLPWLTGVVSTHLHGLRTGLAVPAIGAVLILMLSGPIGAPPTQSIIE